MEKSDCENLYDGIVNLLINKKNVKIPCDLDFDATKCKNVSELIRSIENNGFECKLKHHKDPKDMFSANVYIDYNKIKIKF